MDRFLGDDGGIFKGPYISIKLPYRTSSIGPDFFTRLRQDAPCGSTGRIGLRQRLRPDKMATGDRGVARRAKTDGFGGVPLGFATDARRGSAMEISREAARILKKKYRATRVVLFGSLARSPLFAPTSDIDLYAEGVPGSLFFEAEAEIEEMAKGFRVNLVETKKCPPQFLREIEDEGIDL